MKCTLTVFRLLYSKRLPYAAVDLSSVWTSAQYLQVKAPCLARLGISCQVFDFY